MTFNYKNIPNRYLMLSVTHSKVTVSLSLSHDESMNNRLFFLRYKLTSIFYIDILCDMMYVISIS